MKLAIVVQRYGTEINGGAELHARYISEMLARRHSVEVLTTCAHDYVTWRGSYPEGTQAVNGVTVRRFPVIRERDPEEFGRRSHQVFERAHSIQDEIAWLESEGPTSPALIAHIGEQADAFDAFLFFSYRYYHAWHGIRRVAAKSLLVPTAERDPALGLAIFGSVFRGVRGLFYNSPEERAMIQAVSGNTGVPDVVVGVGSAVPREASPERFRRTFDLREPYIVYVGRIDENKGCRELFDYFTNYRPRLGQRLTLVLMGTSLLSVPDHPHIRHLGFVTDRDKFDGIAGAEALVMPSYYESLSMVALEAWGMGRPVLANGRCDVLRGQVIRSRAGLYYDSFEEFAETLFTLTTSRSLNAALGENGRHFYERHYAWPVIDRKYEELLTRVVSGGSAAAAAIEPLPGWLARRRKHLPAAADVVDGLPEGPVTGSDAPQEPRQPAAADRGDGGRELRPERSSARSSSPHAAAAGPSPVRPRGPDRPQRSGPSGASAGGGQPKPASATRGGHGASARPGGPASASARSDRSRQGRRRRPPRR